MCRCRRAAIDSLNTDTDLKLRYVQRATCSAILSAKPEPSWPDSTATSGTTSWTWRCTRALRPRARNAPRTALPKEGVTMSQTSAQTARLGSHAPAAKVQLSSCARRRPGVGVLGTYTRQRVTDAPSRSSVRYKNVLGGMRECHSG